MTNDGSNDIYEGQLSGSVQGGDLVEYRIIATDASSNANVEIHPDEGYFGFFILEAVEVQDMIDLNLNGRRAVVTGLPARRPDR